MEDDLLIATRKHSVVVEVREVEPTSPLALETEPSAAIPSSHDMAVLPQDKRPAMQLPSFPSLGITSSPINAHNIVVDEDWNQPSSRTLQPGDFTIASAHDPCKAARVRYIAIAPPPTPPADDQEAFKWTATSVYDQATGFITQSARPEEQADQTQTGADRTQSQMTRPSAILLPPQQDISQGDRSPSTWLDRATQAISK
jgi:hypothetical protein